MARFEAKSRTTAESCQALAKATLGRRLKWRTIGAGIVSILALGFMAFSPEARAMTVAILAAGLALLVFFIRTPNRTAKKMFDAVPDATLETLMRFEDDQITTKNRAESGHISYDSIVCVWYSADYYMFYLKSDAVFAIARNDFIKGKAEAFGAFIKEKTDAPLIRA